MSNVKNNANSTKRYQNPELFEQLAMEYAVGSMQGRARKRFEALMETHFYLRAVVDAYENKFAALVELLPDAQPSNQVWKNIKAHVQASAATTTKEEKTPWWQTNFFKQGFGMAAMAVVVSAVLLLNPMTITPEATATAYSAVLESNSSEAMAITKIQKSDMTLSINIMKKVHIADDMELTLWCQPKGGGMPMKMGTISKSGKTNIKISKAEWQEMKNVGSLAISIEHKGESTAMKPTGRILLQGQLSTASLN
jgi:anti-sigma-K factor RskA